MQRYMCVCIGFSLSLSDKIGFSHLFNKIWVLLADGIYNSHQGTLMGSQLFCRD